MNAPSRLLRSLPVILAASFSLVAASGCSKEPAPERAEPRSDARGAAMVLEIAMDEAELTADQAEVVEAIGERVLARRAARAAKHAEMRLAASDMIRSGGQSPEALEAKADELMRVAEERIELEAAALKQLHAVLRPEQRVVVADAVRERIEQRVREREARERSSGVGKLARYLVLDAGQIRALGQLRQELWPRGEEVRPSREEMEGLIDAFETDAFPTELDQLYARKREIARRHLLGAADRADGALSLLSDGQRDLLADLVEKGPEAVGLTQPR